MTDTPKPTPREEALALAVEVLEDVDQGASHRGTSPERLAEVRELARFILGEDGEPAEEGEEDEEDAGPVAPAFRVNCAGTPSDFVEAEAAQTSRGPRVRIALTESGDRSFVVLTPADARRFAAGILNAADEADGTSPTVFGVGTPLS